MMLEDLLRARLFQINKTFMQFIFDLANSDNEIHAQAVEFFEAVRKEFLEYRNVR